MATLTSMVAEIRGETPPATPFDMRGKRDGRGGAR
jgi:hypothetical protein